MSPDDIAKRETLTAFLERGMTTVILDSRQPGVDVPDAHRDARLLLNLSYRFGGVNLQVNDWGVRCSLTFNGAACPVAIPWAALYGVAMRGDPLGRFWPQPSEPPPLTKRRGILGLA